MYQKTHVEGIEVEDEEGADDNGDDTDKMNQANDNDAMNMITMQPVTNNDNDDGMDTARMEETECYAIGAKEAIHDGTRDKDTIGDAIDKDICEGKAKYDVSDDYDDCEDCENYDELIEDKANDDDYGVYDDCDDYFEVGSLTGTLQASGKVWERVGRQAM